MLINTNDIKTNVQISGNKIKWIKEPEHLQWNE